jgi:hypothetical protein
MSPAEKLARIVKVTGVWQRMARDTSFYGTTLAEFKAAVKPSLEAREEIKDLQFRLRVAIRKRNAADSISLKLISSVADGVKGDRRHGDDSALYEAMGYTRETKRIKNIRRARRRQQKRP